MSIKTKKISDLDKIDIKSSSELSEVNFVAGTNSGLTCRVNGSIFVTMLESALNNVPAPIAQEVSADDKVIKDIKKDITSLTSADKIISEKYADLISRISDVETRSKSSSKALNELSLDTTNHILELRAEVQKLISIFESIATEDKLTLAKIQEATKAVLPASQEA